MLRSGQERARIGHVRGKMANRPIGDTTVFSSSHSASCYTLTVWRITESPVFLSSILLFVVYICGVHLWCNFVDLTSSTYLPLCLAQESACRLSRACPEPAFRVTTGAWKAYAQGTGVYACEPANHNSSWTVLLRSTLRIMALFVTKSNP